MMAKPMETLELHYPMIQFLIICNIHAVIQDCMTTGSPHIRLKYEWKNARVLCFEARARNVRSASLRSGTEILEVWDS